ncbi:MAG: AAA family ATPase, partial [Gemmataceae bacterium]
MDVHADSQELLTRAGELVEALGMKRGDTYLEVVDRNHLQHNGAPLAARQLLRWGLARAGVKVPDSGPGSDSDTNSITLYAIDPEQAARPMRERFGLRLLTDDLAAVEELRLRLESEGFRVDQVELLNPESMGDQPRFKLEAGPFAPRRAPSELARLRVAVEDLLSRHGIDPARFPLQVSDRSRASQAVIELPLARLRGPAARPYAGSFPERFAVNVHTDAPDRVGVLQDALRDGGFVRQTVKLVPSLLDRPHEEIPAGMQLRWANAGRDAGVAAALRARAEQAARSAGSALPLEAFDRTGDSDEVDLYFPVKGVADGTLAAWLADPRRYRLRLQGLEGEDAAEIETALKAMGFAGIEVMDGTPRVRGRIDHGTAPMALVERLQDRLRGLLGSQLQSFRAAVDEPVITVQLPKRAAKKAAPKDAAPSAPTVDLAAWLHDPDAPPAALVEASPRCVRVGRVTLERRDADGPMVPDLSSFEHYCLDETTAATLEHIAASVLLREPCLLEGETSTSKTSGVLFVAGLLRQPVVRLNLNGQTDTGELIGRYVPRDDEAVSGAEWDEDGEEGTLAVRERASVGGSLWRWQDGLVVQAMKQGWWVLLDEVNLAEPQILERLNSVLEAEPSLVLTEHENEPIAPVHPSFRVFATMNPAEYAGRSVLSPAYRDRWRGYRFVPRPGEREYLAMLRHLIHGEQPDVVVQGRRYQSGGGPARYAPLAAVLPDGVLVGLARFQSSLEHAAGRGGEAP